MRCQSASSALPTGNGAPACVDLASCTAVSIRSRSARWLPLDDARELIELLKLGGFSIPYDPV